MAKSNREHVMESEATNVETSQQGQGRQEQRDPAASKSRGRSKEIMHSFESRLTRVEEVMNGMEGQVEDLGQKVDGLEEEDATIHSMIRGMMLQLEETLMGHMAKLQEDVLEKLQEVRRAYEEEMSDVRASLEEMRGDMSLCKRALAASTIHPTFEAKRIEVPKPMSFGGVRNAKEVDNFLWGLEQYFGAMGIGDEDAKIQFASLYLSDIAMLWWRRRKGDVEKGLCSMSTFNDFKRELKRQFYPENAEDEARARLRRLKQGGSIQDYIKEFTSLVLEIPDMSDKDALFNFMDGLQHWAKTELRRRGVQDLATAIATAESLVDYSKEPKNLEDKRSYDAKGGDDKGKHKEEKRHESTLTKARHKEKNNNKPYQNRCFLCEGPHWARDCPQKKALNSLLASHKGEEESDRENGMEAQVGAVQLLNGMQAPTKPQGKGLLFVEVAIGGKTTRAMVDTGASHNFISREEAKRMGLQMTKGGGSIKVVNSADKPIDGMAKGVKTNIGAWSGTLNFSVIPLDDYKMVLGMSFLEQARAFPIPFANNLCITEGGQACSVPMIRLGKQGSKVLSAIQLKDGIAQDKRDNLSTRLEARDKPPAWRTCCRTPLSHNTKEKPKFAKSGGRSRRWSQRCRGSRNEGIAGLSGGECHGPPSSKRWSCGGECHGPPSSKRWPCNHEMEDSRRRHVEAMQSRGGHVEAMQSRGGHVEAMHSRRGHVVGMHSRRGHVEVMHY